MKASSFFVAETFLLHINDFVEIVLSYKILEILIFSGFLSYSDLFDDWMIFHAFKAVSAYSSTSFHLSSPRSARYLKLITLSQYSLPKV